MLHGIRTDSLGLRCELQEKTRWWRLPLSKPKEDSGHRNQGFWGGGLIRLRGMTGKVRKRMMTYLPEVARGHVLLSGGRRGHVLLLQLYRRRLPRLVLRGAGEEANRRRRRAAALRVLGVRLLGLLRRAPGVAHRLPLLLLARCSTLCLRPETQTRTPLMVI